MSRTFQRTKHFWVLSVQVAVVNFFVGGFGPAQSLLREDQGTSLKIAGLHGTALGLASITSGYFNSRIVHKLGRRNTIWVGLGIFSIGILFLVFAPPVQLTLIAAYIAGFGTSLTINNTTSSAAEDFKASAHVAMNQMNAIAIVGGALGTVVIGAIATEFRDQWRLGLLLTLPVIFYLFFVRDKDYEKHVPPEHGRQSGRTSIKMKFSILAFYISIACEFGISFWAAALLADRVGSSAALSTLSVFTFAVGSATGRWYISRLIHHMHIDSQLKLSFAFELAAFMLFWFSHNIALSIFALFALGIGLSIQFTVFSVRAIALSDGRPDLAVGYNALAAGTAIATSPFILGLLGDSYGISRAYLLIPALLILGIMIISLFPVKESATK